MYCYYRTPGAIGSKDIFLHHLVKAIMGDNFIKNLDNKQNIFVIDISIK